MHFALNTLALAALSINGAVAHPGPRDHAAAHDTRNAHLSGRAALAPSLVAARAVAGSVTLNAGSGASNEDVSVSGNTAAISLASPDTTPAYTVKFASTASSTRRMVIWNKVGSDGLANSGSFVTKAVTTKFDLAPGETKTVAFEPNTQAAFCDWSEGKRTAAGQFDCPYGEVNMAPKQLDGTLGWSAADVSVYNQSPDGNGKGYPCNLNIAATGATDGKNSTCTDNYYYVASGSGLPNGLGVVVPESSEAHFVALVGDMGVAS